MSTVVKDRIVSILEDADEPLTFGEILDRMRRYTPSEVRNDLRKLEEEGEVGCKKKFDGREYYLE